MIPHTEKSENAGKRRSVAFPPFSGGFPQPDAKPGSAVFSEFYTVSTGFSTDLCTFPQGRCKSCGKTGLSGQVFRYRKTFLPFSPRAGVPCPHRGGKGAVLCASPGYENPPESGKNALRQRPCRLLQTAHTKKQAPLRAPACVFAGNYFRASSIATATATVIPTIGLLPAPIRPIISTCAGTEEEPANCASECILPIVSVMP